MHLDECLHWAAAYTTLSQKLNLQENTPEHLQSVFLWLRYKAAYVALSCSQSTSQMIYDNYLEDFKEIIRIAKILQAHPTGNSIFVFDLKYIAQLYITSIRCRHPKVRREAIGILLLRPYREGVWDSIVAGKMATAIMELEEEGMVGDYIPEENRVRGTLMRFNLTHRAGTLKCFLNTAQGLVVKERDVKW